MPLQIDGNNCGVYAMYYMDCIGQNKEYDVEFEPNEFRQEIAKILLENRKEMENGCQHCFVQDNKTKMDCNRCGKKSHKSCIKTNYTEKSLQKLINIKENTYTRYVCKVLVLT